MDWTILWEYRAALASGLAITMAVSALAIIGATLVGVLVGCLRGSSSYLLQRLTATYTELLRNLPLIVKLFFLYFVLGLPALPYLLRDLEETRDGRLSKALTAITGCHPVPAEDRGKIRQVAEAWLRWAKENGHQW